jgi:hypothetical protein
MSAPATDRRPLRDLAVGKYYNYAQDIQSIA